MYKYIIITLFLFSSPLWTKAQNFTKNDLKVGEIIKFESSILNENRTLNIYLPKSYQSDSLKSYNVIYLLDGSIDEDFIHIAGLVQFCSFSWINIIPESIVVGIGNVDRKRDFTYPSQFDLDNKEFPTSGGSSSFINFMETELIPFIKERYRCTNTSSLIGQSLGGLFATQILFEKPELFEKYIIVSPSLWWDEERLLKSKLHQSMEGRSVYIAVGNEGELMIRLAQSLFNKLSIEKSNELSLYFHFLENQNHGDALHLAVYDAFEKLFKSTEE